MQKSSWGLTCHMDLLFLEVSKFSSLEQTSVPCFQEVSSPHSFKYSWVKVKHDLKRTKQEKFIDHHVVKYQGCITWQDQYIRPTLRLMSMHTREYNTGEKYNSGDTKKPVWCSFPNAYRWAFLKKGWFTWLAKNIFQTKNITQFSQLTDSKFEN